MAIQVQFRRGTTANIATFTGAVGEVVVDTDKDTLVVMDGSVAGGYPLAKENNPTHTGNMTLTTSGAYIQFPDGTRQYTANPQIFYMILPGSLYTPLVGSSRYYPINNITINTIYYNFSQASTSSVSFSVLVNGTVVNTYSINANVYSGSITSVATSVSNTSYVSINVNSGNGSDLTFRFAYT